jgi:hypothetical protein
MRLSAAADFSQLLVGKLDLALWQHVQYQRFAICNRGSMIGPRFKYTPSPGHSVKSSALGDGHDHANLSRWMAVVWPNYVFQIDYVDAQSPGLFARFYHAAKAPTR